MGKQVVYMVFMSVDENVDEHELKKRLEVVDGIKVERVVHENFHKVTTKDIKMGKFLDKRLREKGAAFWR